MATFRRIILAYDPRDIIEESGPAQLRVRRTPEGVIEHFDVPLYHSAPLLPRPGEELASPSMPPSRVQTYYRMRRPQNEEAMEVWDEALRNMQVSEEGYAPTLPSDFYRWTSGLGELPRDVAERERRRREAEESGQPFEENPESIRGGRTHRMDWFSQDLSKLIEEQRLFPHPAIREEAFSPSLPINQMMEGGKGLLLPERVIAPKDIGEAVLDQVMRYVMNAVASTDPDGVMVPVYSETSMVKREGERTGHVAGQLAITDQNLIWWLVENQNVIAKWHKARTDAVAKARKSGGQPKIPPKPQLKPPPPGIKLSKVSPEYVLEELTSSGQLRDMILEQALGVRTPKRGRGDEIEESDLSSANVDELKLAERGLSKLWVMYTSMRVSNKGGFSRSDQSPYGYFISAIRRAKKKAAEGITEGKETAETSLQTFEGKTQNSIMEVMHRAKTADEAERVLSENRNEAWMLINGIDPGFGDEVNDGFTNFMFTSGMQMPSRFYTLDLLNKMIPHLALDTEDSLKVLPESFCPNCGRSEDIDPQTGELVPAMELAKDSPQRKTCRFCTFADPQTGEPTDERFWIPSNVHQMLIGMPGIAALAYLNSEAMKELAAGGEDFSQRFVNLRLAMTGLSVPVIIGGGGVTPSGSHRRQFSFLAVPYAEDPVGLRLFPEVVRRENIAGMSRDEVALLHSGISIGEFLATQGWRSPYAGREMRDVSIVPFDQWADEGWRIFTNPADRALMFAGMMSEQVAGGGEISPDYGGRWQMPVASQEEVPTEDPIQAAAWSLFRRATGTGRSNTGAVSEQELRRVAAEALPSIAQEVAANMGDQADPQVVGEAIMRAAISINEHARDVKTLGQKKSAEQTAATQDIVRSCMYAANWVYTTVIARAVDSLPMPDQDLREIVSSPQISSVIGNVSDEVLGSYPYIAGKFGKAARPEIARMITSYILMLNREAGTPQEWMETVGYSDEDVAHVYEIMSGMGADLGGLSSSFGGAGDADTTKEIEAFHGDVVSTLVEEALAGKTLPKDPEKADQAKKKIRDAAEKKWKKAVLWLKKSSTISSSTSMLRSKLLPGPMGDAAKRVFSPIFVENEKGKRKPDIVEMLVDQLSDTLSGSMAKGDPYAAKPGVPGEMGDIIKGAYESQYGTEEAPYREINRLKSDLAISATGLFGFGNEYGNEVSGRIEHISPKEQGGATSFRASVDGELPDGYYNLLFLGTKPVKMKDGTEDQVPNHFGMRARLRGNEWSTNDSMRSEIKPGIPFIIGNYVPSRTEGIGEGTSFRTSADYSPEAISERYRSLDISPEDVVVMRNAILDYSVDRFISSTVPTQEGTNVDPYAAAKILFTALLPVDLQMAFQYGDKKPEEGGTHDPTSRALNFLIEVKRAFDDGIIRSTEDGGVDGNRTIINRILRSYPPASGMIGKVVREFETGGGPSYNSMRVMERHSGSPVIASIVGRQTLNMRGLSGEEGISDAERAFMEEQERGIQGTKGGNQGSSRGMASTMPSMGWRRTAAARDGYRIILHANTNDKRERGLMFSRPIGYDEVALFTFPRADDHSFWNMNVSFPLTLAFCDSDGRVLSIRDMDAMSRNACRAGDQRVKYVIEAMRGALDGVSVGDKMAISEDGMHVRFL